MFIACDSADFPSSVRSGSYRMSLLTELGTKAHSSYKHRAPNGAENSTLRSNNSTAKYIYELDCSHVRALLLEVQIDWLQRQLFRIFLSLLNQPHPLRFRP